THTHQDVTQDEPKSISTKTTICLHVCDENRNMCVCDENRSNLELNSHEATWCVCVYLFVCVCVCVCVCVHVYVLTSELIPRGPSRLQRYFPMRSEKSR